MVMCSQNEMGIISWSRAVERLNRYLMREDSEGFEDYLVGEHDVSTDEGAAAEEDVEDGRALGVS